MTAAECEERFGFGIGEHGQAPIGEQRDHQQHPKPFPKWMLGQEPLQAGDNFRWRPASSSTSTASSAAAARSSERRAISGRANGSPATSASAGPRTTLGPPIGGQLRRQDRPQPGRRAPPAQPLEPDAVEGLGVDVEGVTLAPRGEQPGTDRLTQLRHVVLQHAEAGGGGLLAHRSSISWSRATTAPWWTSRSISSARCWGCRAQGRQRPASPAGDPAP